MFTLCPADRVSGSQKYCSHDRTGRGFRDRLLGHDNIGKEFKYGLCGIKGGSVILEASPKRLETALIHSDIAAMMTGLWHGGRCGTLSK